MAGKVSVVFLRLGLARFMAGKFPVVYLLLGVFVSPGLFPSILLDEERLRLLSRLLCCASSSMAGKEVSCMAGKVVFLRLGLDRFIDRFMAGKVPVLYLRSGVFFRGAPFALWLWRRPGGMSLLRRTACLPDTIL